ncbi:tyrosine-type recombinase/integrase [Clostridium chromiireducens]|uniref:Tyrosine-type recombinase/integrase n=1 Tax=Clostridium chromiireducens TaxID=225345 RepID=A0A964W0R3_9CLOT|nr:site-specific integrase [Clostridium chromiireducens]MVX62272.1 tyrosine-type recombinase/integrase [Clostridium chromiireducens]
MPTYKDEKRGTYYCSFYYTDFSGNKRRKKKEGFKKQSDAKAFERDFLQKQENNCDMQFKNLVDLYLDDAKTRIRSTTLNNKTELINLKILPYFSELIVSEITPNHIRKWQNELKKSSYSDTYLKAINNQLTAIFNFAIKYFNLASSPTLKAGSMGKKNAEAMQFWTVDEFKSFIGYCKDNKLELAYKILFWTGIRRGELLALTYNDIDLENRLISINKTYTKIKNTDIINPPKTAKSKRMISISESLANDIREYYDTLYDFKPSERIFEFSLSRLRHSLNSICKKNEIKRIRVHDLRHSHASLLIELGFTALAISERLGHEKVQTTLNTYSHLYPNKDMTIANKLDDLY